MAFFIKNSDREFEPLPDLKSIAEKRCENNPADPIISKKLREFIYRELDNAGSKPL